MADGDPLVLDGTALTVDDLVAVARDPSRRVEIAPEAVERVVAGRQEIDAALSAHRESAGDAPVMEYGVTTGFGSFKDVALPPDDLAELQRRLLLSHCVGMGDTADPDDPANYLPAEVVRAALVIRLNTFLRGHSGVRPVLAETLAAMVGKGITPLVPIHGSLGASGDLAPLAHLFAVLVGEGRYTVPGDGAWRDAAGLEADLGVPPPPLAPKEGLALINGTAMSTALLALAIHDADRLAAAADAAAALTLEGLAGAARAFDPRVHDARGHPGQVASAAAIRAMVAGSELVDGRGQVQDPYSIRCAPQVHGASRDALGYARRVVDTEINAATDNPLFFPGEDPWDLAFAANWPAGYDGRARRAFSAGNFHGQPVALAADLATVAVAELASVSERRTQMLLDPDHNGGLPRNLAPRGGLNSGAMVAHYAAAALVSENKVLSHPASVDSIPTSANIEDHVSMSAAAARKLRTVVARSQAVLAVELLVAAQAVDWRTLGSVDDAAFASHTASASRLGSGTRRVYEAVRSVSPPLVDDRPLAAELAGLRRLVAGWSMGDAAD